MYELNYYPKIRKASATLENKDIFAQIIEIELTSDRFRDPVYHIYGFM